MVKKVLKNKKKMKNGLEKKKKFRKTWQLIHEMSSCLRKKKVIADIEIGETKISSAFEIAEDFTFCFTNIGHGSSQHTRFSPAVVALMKLNRKPKPKTNKATGFDNFQSNMPKSNQLEINWKYRETVFRFEK